MTYPRNACSLLVYSYPRTEPSKTSKINAHGEIMMHMVDLRR